MTRLMWLALASCVLFLIAIIDFHWGGFVVSMISEHVESGSGFDAEFYTAFYELQAYMGLLMSGIGFVVISDVEAMKSAKRNPLVIELSRNTAMGHWIKGKDVLIGAPFSDDKDLAADGNTLVKTVNNIIRAFTTKKGGSNASLWVEIRVKSEDGQKVSQGEMALLEKVLAQSIANNGAIIAQ